MHSMEINWYSNYKQYKCIYLGKYQWCCCCKIYIQENKKIKVILNSASMNWSLDS